MTGAWEASEIGPERSAAVVAADLLDLEEVRYALGLHRDHEQVTETVEATTLDGRTFTVEVPLPSDESEARLRNDIVQHDALIAKLRGTR